MAETAILQRHSQALPERIHLVGIGGVGLSAIARVLVMRGHRVTGSDLRASPITEELARLGVGVSVGHASAQVADAQLVIISSAIPEGNVEVQAARAAGIPVLKRRDMLGTLMLGQRVLAVAGTHGKTTTSAMLSVILDGLGRDPSFIVGGLIQDLGTNARAGHGDDFVIEADEYDYAFYGLDPDVAVITNVEMDHPDCFADIAAVRKAFGGFVRKIKPGGSLVACADSPQLMRALDAQPWLGSRLETWTYGLGDQARYRVGPVTVNDRGGIDFVVFEGQLPWVTCSLGIAGVHNALNATAALIVADRCGLERQAAAQALRDFRGARRRFEIKGQAGGIVVVDDYAHHPTEIRATLAAARQRYPHRSIWAVFQPHTFSRTSALLEEFAACFPQADRVVVTDIFKARPKEKETVSAQDLVQRARHPDIRHIATYDEIVAYLLDHLQAGDLLVTLGAGDGYLIGERVLQRLGERGSP
ncbi:MAG: UDP-N-acetylmuramate--L-alanine ligase [Anaerolineae bacterium]|nr:UDP-N-acetylmuramate--L-alanine ligase [Anaerolineae bacterium]